MEPNSLHIAMFSLHSSPIGALGTRDTGGMSVYVRELARSLGQKGHRVDIFTRKTDPLHHVVQPLFNNVDLVLLEMGHTGPIPKIDLYEHLPAFWQAANAYRHRHHRRYDIVHSHYWLSGCLGRWAQNRWNVPHIMMFHTLSDVKNRLVHTPSEPELRLETERQLALSCHRILVAAEREKAFVTRNGDIDPDKVGVVTCGVNLNLFKPQDRPKAKRQLGLDSGERIILSVGRLDPLKQIDRLMSAVTYLPPDCRTRLVIIGGDGHADMELQRLKALAADLQIQNQVTFAGRVQQENLPTYYNAADLLVVSSAYESFGLVGLESLACGTPVVATPVGAMEHIIQDGHTGRLVPNDRPEFIARAIEDVFVLVDRGALSAQQIRATVHPYDWSAVASAVLDEYRSVIRSASSGAPPPANIKRLN